MQGESELRYDIGAVLFITENVALLQLPVLLNLYIALSRTQ